MPRIPTSLILKGYQRNPLLPLLLQECRSLDSAQNELRWLRERAIKVRQSIHNRRVAGNKHVASGWRGLLRSMCRARSRGVPLQYILGDQPFGDLEILCRKGVLIPRSETESFAIHTANLIVKNAKQNGAYDGVRQSLRIIDLCAGTGCISLLLHSLLESHFRNMFILGIDISAAAVRLATKNREHNIQLGLLSSRSTTEVDFRLGNVLGDGDDLPGAKSVIKDFISSYRSKSTSSLDDDFTCDVLISNPPYISPTSFRDGTTARSVRMFEPWLALVPPSDVHDSVARDCRQEDIFYHHIVKLSLELGVKLTVLECGDLQQAERVACVYRSLALTVQETGPANVEIWPDIREDQVGNEDGPFAVIIHMRIN